MHGETQSEEEMRRVVMSMVANLIANGGARVMLEKLRAVFEKGGGGGDVVLNTHHASAEEVGDVE